MTLSLSPRFGGLVQERRVGTTEEEKPKVFFSLSTKDLDELVPSFRQQLAYVVEHLKGDPENQAEFVNDLSETSSPGELEWVVEQWAHTIELEETEPELVVDLLKRLHNRGN